MSDLGPAGNATAYTVWDYFNPLNGPLALVSTTPGSTYSIPEGTAQPESPAGAHRIRYDVWAPVLPGGFVLYGETGKIVTMSRQRIAGLTTTATGFSASIRGYYGEKSVTYLTGKAGVSGVTSVVCPSGAGVMATLACDAATGCSCK